MHGEECVKGGIGALHLAEPSLRCDAPADNSNGITRSNTEKHRDTRRTAGERGCRGAEGYGCEEGGAHLTGCRKVV